MPQHHTRGTPVRYQSLQYSLITSLPLPVGYLSSYQFRQLQTGSMDVCGNQAQAPIYSGDLFRHEPRRDRQGVRKTGRVYLP